MRIMFSKIILAVLRIYIFRLNVKNATYLYCKTKAKKKKKTLSVVFPLMTFYALKLGHFASFEAGIIFQSHFHRI